MITRGLKQRPAHAVDQHMRDDAHRWQNRDVNLRVSEEPEQVLPEQRRTARVRLQAVADHQARRNEKTGARDAIQDQQQASGQEHGKGQQARCTT